MHYKTGNICLMDGIACDICDHKGCPKICECGREKETRGAPMCNRCYEYKQDMVDKMILQEEANADRISIQ